VRRSCWAGFFFETKVLIVTPVVFGTHDARPG
jgi:hypothetical protein